MTQNISVSRLEYFANTDEGIVHLVRSRGARLFGAAPNQECGHEISQPYARELARQVDELENENASLRERVRVLEEQTQMPPPRGKMYCHPDDAPHWQGLRTALEPFAARAKAAGPHLSDETTVTVFVKDCRDAEVALNAIGSQEG